MNAGKTLRLAAPSYISTHPERLHDGLIETLNRILATADRFNADLAAARADRNLSPEGRAAAGAKVAATALAALSAIEATKIKGLTDHAESLEKELLSGRSYRPPTDPAERVAHELQLQEIRNQLRQLPLAERANVYRTSTDPLTLAAIETAPMTLSETRPDGSRRMEPFIDPTERRAATIARAERSHPASVALLREAESLREVYSLAINGVRREILEEVRSGPLEAMPV
jgi:hypothetical protein